MRPCPLALAPRTLVPLALALLALAACGDPPPTQVVAPSADLGAPDRGVLPPPPSADALLPDAGPVDVCEGQICAPGYRCDARGDCVEACAGVVCEAGRVCEGGECVDPCAEVRCAEGLSCAGGECVDLCAAAACAPEERCTPETGACVDRCEGVSCPGALRCSPRTGECVAQCDGVLCGGEEVCDARTGRCVDLCARVTCPEPFVCNPASGACVDPCREVECVRGWVCEGGDCLYDDPCAGVQCPAGALCDPRDRRCSIFSCAPDDLEGPAGAASNNVVEGATPLAVGTQRIDDLTVCPLDIDWYELAVPAQVSLRVGLRSQPAAGLLNLRLYEASSVLRAAVEVDAPLGDAFVSVLPERAARRVWVRVASANGQFSQNRYSLTLEQNLPGVLCQQDSQCGAGVTCTRGLCGGVGEVNPDPADPVDLPDPADPTDPPPPPPPPACVDDAREPNDVFVNATAAAPGVYAGAVCPDNADLFRVDVPAPSEVRGALAYSFARGDLDLYLLDATGVPLDTSVGVSDAEEVRALIPAAGPVYLSVFGATAAAAGDYTLDVQVTPSALPADACVDSFDPNDSFDRARPLPLPATLTGLALCEPDFYVLSLADGERVEVEVRFTHDDGDIDISLFDPRGDSVDISFGYGNLEMVSYDVPPGGGGLYVLDVRLFRGEGPQTYSLTARVSTP